MFKKWIPKKLIIKRAARAYGVIDPISVLARLRRFSQPSEVQEPIELIRAGIIFHARGLINTRAIQNNLDWIWPFWVEKQFNPRDISFIPRAFAFSHVNLTQRDWTAVGLPDADSYPLVDPRGLVTPFYDGWSLDFWVVSEDNASLFPSRNGRVVQKLHVEPNLRVETRSSLGDSFIHTEVEVQREQEVPFLRIAARSGSGRAGFFVVSVRPYNPEGIQFVENIDYDPAGCLLDINRQHLNLKFSKRPDKTVFSAYRQGDVLQHLDEPAGKDSVTCRVGMATAAVMYRLTPDKDQELSISLPLEKRSRKSAHPAGKPETWSEALQGCAHLLLPDQRFMHLYQACIRTLILLSAKDIVPGPYTYKRFWFRDACFMLQPMLALGLFTRSRRIIGSFFARQKISGYFHSQEGEWDSNGQVLWIMQRYLETSGEALPESWVQPVLSGAEWIRKKTAGTGSEAPHAGLFPAGFSAEHLGPNDYYYWDNFWGIAGLEAAAAMFAQSGQNPQTSRRLAAAGLRMREAVFGSIAMIEEKRRQGGIPASPYRRLDAGAVGSLVADYPLQLVPPEDPAINTTVEFLLANCFKDFGFFQDIIHSGINVYLTLDIAQTMLRNQDPRFMDLVQTVAGLASPTGQWPEAVHPFSGGGCMGDGQHGWAAAEWVMMLKNMFVREEGRTVIFGSGLFPEWLEQDQPLRFGPVHTPLGLFAVHVFDDQGTKQVEVTAEQVPPDVDLSVRIPGYERIDLQEGTTRAPLRKIGSQ